MPTREDCIEDIVKRTGGRKTRRQVEDFLDDILDHADEYQHDGLSPDMAYAKARDERLEAEAERAANAKKQERENSFKAIDLHRWGDEVRKQKNVTARLAVEARLVGVNTPFYRSQDSVAARGNTYADKWLGAAGVEGALERANVFKQFASGAHDADVARELWQMDMGKHGSPGITKNEVAKTIADILHTADKQALAEHNAAGGFIQSMTAHLAKTTHDPDAIRYAAAGGRNRPLISFDLNPWAVGGTNEDAAVWIADVEKFFDMRKSFPGLPDAERKDMLRQMWAAFSDGDHFTYGASHLDDPIYANVGKKAAAHRTLIPKSADGWMAYNEKYGLYRNLREAKLRAYETLAKQTALIQTFGTKPGETFDEWIGYLKNQMKGSEEKNEFQKFEHTLRNEFAWLDGSANHAVNRIAARTIRNWMAWERMSMLGRVLFTHIAGLPTKSAEVHYWGSSLGERYGSIVSGMTRTDADLAQSLWASYDATRSFIASKYDAVDTPSGVMSRMENLFFRLSGVSRLLDNQRVNSEQVFSHLAGRQKGKAWAEIPSDLQRVLRLFGIDEPEWKTLNRLPEWTKGRGMEGDQAFLTPSDALKLSDDDIRAYLKARPKLGQMMTQGDDLIGATRNELAQRLATAYGERGRYAMFMPGVRAKARLFGQMQTTNPFWYKVLQLTAQFRLWPMEMIYRTWGREVYGRAGDPVFKRIAAPLELAVASIVFGVASNMMRELTQGQDPITRMINHPGKVIADGFLRSGAGTIFGDYLFGEFDRHGRQASAQILGPTFGKIDQVMDLLHGGGPNERHPWKRRAADLMEVMRENTPFVNLFFTSAIWQYLVVYRLQEWMHPGYLARMEQKAKEDRGQRFLVSPQHFVH